MTRSLLTAFVLIPALLGCGPRAYPAKDRVVVFVPGVSGDGPWYDGVKRGLGDVRIDTLAWGAPMPLFAMNFSNRGIHDAAEAELAKRLRRLAGQRAGRIDIVAHSAGCGVALGALRRLGEPIIDAVVLLAPSVSPSYDLAPALASVRGNIHVFHSDRDALFLSWRTSRFGTYDNVKTKAAGNMGFDVAGLAPELRTRVVQHAYEPQWRELGNDGTHDGPVARGFVARVVAPLLGLTPAAP